MEQPPAFLEEENLFWLQFKYYASRFAVSTVVAYLWEWRGVGKIACEAARTGVCQIVVKWGYGMGWFGGCSGVALGFSGDGVAAHGRVGRVVRGCYKRSMLA